jgi:membrane-associated PAP2 superfamily phosphatase
LSEVVHFDLYVQDRLYDPARGWLVDRNAKGSRFIFYELPKWILCVIFLGLLACIVAPALYSAPLPLSPREAGFLMACIIVLPITAWYLKRITGVLYPCHVVRYGGKNPYRTLLQSIPKVAGRVRGRGFPAAHCSGAFALMALYFVMPEQTRWIGLALGLVAGWTVGIYQMLKGVHYLSHTVVTMFMAWMIILILSRAFGMGVVV